MPTHYVYRDPNKSTLNQGDILQKTPELLAHLHQFHAYYATQPDYKYFMVLTQTCDLVRRDGICTSPYITIAACRPVEEAIRREAAKSQEPWQRESGVIGAKTAVKMVMFLESLLDNNQDGYFYLHQDVGLGIHQNCCAFLPLLVTLKINHYQLCLDAKIAELSDIFQSKLGSILGQMFSRVAAPEWNENSPEKKAGEQAAEMLKRTLRPIDDDKIAEGVADLKSDGRWDQLSATQIRDYITRFKINPKRDLIKQRAVDWFCEPENKLVELIRGRIEKPLKNDAELASGIDTLLDGAGVPVEAREGLRKQIIYKFMDRLVDHFSDGKMPDKRAVMEKILTMLMQDGTIRTILG
jgi:hypothetical protein